MREGVDRQTTIGVQEEQGAATCDRGSGVHLHAASAPRRDDAGAGGRCALRRVVATVTVRDDDLRIRFQAAQVRDGIGDDRALVKRRKDDAELRPNDRRPRPVDGARGL